ncbi:stomatin 2 [Stylonychia lemnae]|uniref:Stomatin 2 n=1 Tax=Stylonychia lemnae TaxID=5949 RepID=A0A078AW78_STYLE|nr:stomatin 2 [Stylonychia lemnae]|eukprot:CDW85053.1 stomatin 2 [Stylonychia lemnae]
MSKIFMPFVLVPQQHIMIVERFGRYMRTLEPGFKFKLPLFESVAYHHSLKEQVLGIDSQTAITRDNVKIRIDGVMYFKITDPFKASYEVAQPIRALSLLAQTSMRSEIGKLDLDRTFEERESLNVNIKEALNEASVKWGIECMRYEIKDIKPPEEIKRSMELQAESERIKRSKILNSEGERQSKINIAEGIKQSAILDGQGNASKILEEARGICQSLERIAKSIESGPGGRGQDALRLKLTEQYLEALNQILSTSRVLMLPNESGSGNSDQWSTSKIATAMTLYKQILGPAGQAVAQAAGKAEGDLFNELRQRVAQLDQQSSATQNQVVRERKFQYHDDKALYSDQ